MRLRHFALPAAAGLTLLAVPFAPAAVAAAPACDPAANTCTVTFDYSGGAQTFTVPAGVSNLAVAIGGARGGDGLEVDGSPQGGPGGAMTAIVPVTPGEVLTLLVGSKGGDGSPTATTPAPGGYGGGGAGSNAGSTAAPAGSVAGGGGGSFLFGSDGLLIAAGGGGGAGFTGATGDPADGGKGGATSGSTGSPAAFGGVGATAGSAGAGGGGDDATAGSGPASAPNALGRGGASVSPCGAAGGGGGFYGGGSGGCDTTTPPETTLAKTAGGSYAGVDAPAAKAAAVTETIYHAGGGGGGSGFAATGVSPVETDLASGLDNGRITLGYTTAATTTTIATDVTTLAPGQEATINATVDGPDLTIVGDDTEDGPAGAAAAAAFGASAAAAVKAAAVPTTPAPAGTTLNPGTACGATPCTVTFFVNGKQLVDPIEIDPATGVASIIFTAGSEEGVREITARYDGNLYYLQSQSDPLSITVAGLANTGPGHVAPLLATSALLLAAGTGLVAFGRRRPQLGSHRAA